MRLASLVLLASLSVAPGCVLAVPPVVGAAGGMLIDAAQTAGGHKPRTATYAVAGIVAGLVVDAVVFSILVEAARSIEIE